MASFQKYLAELIASNRQLADHIHVFAEAQQSPNRPKNSEDGEAGACTAAFLDKIYSALCSMKAKRGHPRTTNRAILAAWTSFFLPIRSLTCLPFHGDFLAARMILYLTTAFLSQNALDSKFPETESSVPKVAELHSFLSALDEQLLRCLRSICMSRNAREEFSWVFFHYQVDEASEDNPKAGARHERATVTSPAALAALGGANGRETPDGDRQGVGWQYGDDGPIRENFCYHIVDLDNGSQQYRGRPPLRRSRQFIFDARHFAQRLLGQDRQRLTAHVLDVSPLALETKLQILSYLDEPVVDPYLSNFSLAEVYSAFPDVDTKCLKCMGKQSTKADRAMKQTCPQASLTVWNLALRAFHTFHRRSKNGDWLLCQDIGCQGHHADSDWMVTNETQFLAMLDAIVCARCGPGATLKSVGLGPVDEITLASEEEDNERRKLLFSTMSPVCDAQDDRLMRGGIAGVAHAMLHGQTMTGRWQGQMTGGGSMTDPAWCVGRTKGDEGSSQWALKALHIRCGLC